MKEKRIDLIRFSVSAVMVIITLLVSMSDIAKLIISIAAALISGYKVLFECAEHIIHGDFLDENALMLIASVVAFILGEYFEGVFIIVLFGVGEMLEDVASDRAREKIAALSELKEVKVRLKDGKSVDPETVPVGTLIEIFKGERVIIDGVLMTGDAELDLKAVTGESRIYAIEKGKEVYGGAINLGDSIIVKTTKLFKDSTVERIVAMVEGANAKKAKSQKFISKFAKIYTPVVVLLAVGIAFLPTLLFGKDLSEFVYKALSFLIVSCPCALVISVPLGYFVGIGALSKHGVLIKGSSVIDELAEVKTFVFDKTGTLTKGELSVDKVFTYGNYKKEEILSYAASVERHSTHPIGKAIAEFAKDLPLVKVTDVKEVGGKGLISNANGKEIKVGNAKFVFATDNSDTDSTCVYVAIDGEIAGKITLNDKLKDNARKVVKELSDSCVTIAILSGDNKETAERIGKELNIDNVYSELLPEEKVEHLKKIKSLEKGKVAYVGDGINDSPCIAEADVGIAMGAIGSEISIETADAVILNDDLYSVVRAKKHSRRVKRVVFSNVFGSIFVKVSIMVLALP